MPTLWLDAGWYMRVVSIVYSFARSLPASTACFGTSIHVLQIVSQFSTYYCDAPPHNVAALPTRGTFTAETLILRLSCRYPRGWSIHSSPIRRQVPDVLLMTALHEIVITRFSDSWRSSRRSTYCYNALQQKETAVPLRCKLVVPNQAYGQQLLVLHCMVDAQIFDPSTSSRRSTVKHYSVRLPHCHREVRSQRWLDFLFSPFCIT